MITYDSVSFKLSKDEVARAAVVQFVTTTSEQISLWPLKRDPRAAARELRVVVDAALAQRGKLAQRDK